jgi:valyl-tRNA synthetase
MWNAVRFAMMNLGDDYRPPEVAMDKQSANLTPASRWALSRLDKAVAAVNTSMETYDFNGSTTGVYAFWQYDLCDVFIELMKPVVAGTDEDIKKSTRDVLWTLLDAGLRLLHPFMPFVTEELWQRLPRRKAETARSIMIADYPVSSPDTRQDEPVETQMQSAMDVVKAIRALRASYNLPPKAKPEVFVVVRGEEAEGAMTTFADAIGTLSSAAESCKVLAPSDELPAGCGVSVVNESITVYVMLKGQVDPATEITKLEKKVVTVKKQIADLEKKMAMEGYAEKVPENVRVENEEKKLKLEAEVQVSEAAVEDFKKLL